MDKASWGGVALGLGGIVGGLLLEGGRLSQVLQPTAAMIVFGGTTGAVLIQFPLPVVLEAVRRLGDVFVPPVVTTRRRSCRSWSATPTRPDARGLFLWMRNSKKSRSRF